MRSLGVFVMLLASCAPIGKPACVTPQVAPIEKPMPDMRKYYECGKAIECGVWCRVSDECREIEKEMEQ